MRVVQSAFIILIFICCCRHDKKEDIHDHQADAQPVSVKFAKGFNISKHGSYQILTIFNPWQKAKNISYRYHLCTSDTLIDHTESETVIKVPVKKVICLSTTHIGFIDYIDELESIAGLSGTRYVSNPYLLDQVSRGKVHDIGYDEGINYELILKLQPDLVIAYGVSGNETGFSEKLKELGIQVMFIAEYLEENPLAKMEWVKVFAALYQKEKEVSEKYDIAVDRYVSLVRKASGSKHRPAVLLGLPWKGTWYISGGDSYIAKLISDAGGNYLWSNTQYRDSKPMSLETIFSKAFEAEFWLNTGVAGSVGEILDIDERFGALSCIKNSRVYNNNNLVNSRGGNEYFEKGVVEPDVILADLIKILHPEMLPSHQLKYYQRLH
jgi:iron complex transport system substrate-binding protein